MQFDGYYTLESTVLWQCPPAQMPSPCSRGRQDGGGRAWFHCTSARLDLAASSGALKPRTEDITLGFYECCAIAVGESLKENAEEAERVERDAISNSVGHKELWKESKSVWFGLGRCCC